MFGNNIASSFVLGALTGASIAYGLIRASGNTLSSSLSNNNNINNINNTSSNSENNNNNNVGNRNGTLSIQESNSALCDLFQNTSIEYLTPTSTPVIMIEYQSSTDPYRSSIDFALMLMEDNDIVSIPVVDLEKRIYVGMLNVLDVVSYLASNYTNQNRNNQEFATALRSASVADVLKFTKDHILPLSATSPLTHLVRVATLADEVPIMGSEGQIVNIANRLDVLRFVQDNIEVLGPRADYTVHTLFRGSSSLTIIDTDTRVVDALGIMGKTQVSELAIVNTTGRLEGNLIAADLRRLSVYNLPRLFEPVSKFVCISPDSIVWVEPTSTLRDVISKFVESKTAVVWIVENTSSFRPIDSITLRSLMNHLLAFSSNGSNI